MRAMRACERFDPIAWRSWSASAALNPAQSIAICMSCSWNSGTPSVFASARLDERMDVGDLLLAVAAPQVRVHRTALDRPGPDQRDLHHEVVEARGRSRGSVAICARLSTWNTPTVSAAHNRS